MNQIIQQVEALIFTAEQSISIADITACLNTVNETETSKDDILHAIEALKVQYSNDLYSFEVIESGGGYQFLSKTRYHDVVGQLLQHRSKKRLSTAAMETLAIVSYKQPITKAEVEHIRGVSSDYSIQKLLEKDLIEISGKSEGPGKPVLYSTSKTFMDYFGINTTRDLPQLKDIYVNENEIGSQTE